MKKIIIVMGTIFLINNIQSMDGLFPVVASQEQQQAAVANKVMRKYENKKYYQQRVIDGAVKRQSHMLKTELSVKQQLAFDKACADNILQNKNQSPRAYTSCKSLIKKLASIERYKDRLQGLENYSKNRSYLRQIKNYFNPTLPDKAVQKSAQRTKQKLQSQERAFKQACKRIVGSIEDDKERDLQDQFIKARWHLGGSYPGRRRWVF